MTRRRVLFLDADGKAYLTEEYNGDKTEFALFGVADTCEKDWRDIMDEFRDCLSLRMFFATDRRCQGYYHSQLGVSEYQAPKEVTLADLVDTNGICVTAANSLSKTSMEPAICFLRRHIADLADASSLIDMMERAFARQVLAEILGKPVD